MSISHKESMSELRTKKRVLVEKVNDASVEIYISLAFYI